MPIANLPVWAFEPNWTSGVSESLEWLTDILASPTGSEQRRTLRVDPRRSFEFRIAVAADVRSYFDNMLVTYGAADWHLPIWQEVNLLDDAALAGESVLACATAMSSEFRVGAAAIIVDDTDPFEFELVEIAAITPAGLTLVNELERFWSADSRLYPVYRARLTDQPRPQHQTDTLAVSEIRFVVVEPGMGEAVAYPDPTSWLTEIYGDYRVLHLAPDYRRPADFEFQRNLIELDNATGIPVRADQAGRAFTLQKYTWVMEGRAEKAAFRAVLRTLRGRARPIWLPTFMQDFELASPIAAGASTIVVGRAGYALAGGPRWDRQDIMIETDRGNLFRRITNVVVDGAGREILVLSAPIPDAYRLEEVLRISFMALSRLNHDTVEFAHQTDTEGVASCQLTFRSAPDTRQPLPA